MPLQKNCRNCGNSYPIKKSHYDKSSYCSRACMAEDYRNRLAGDENPNYKGAGKHVCPVCGREFIDYDTKAKYCSMSCRDRDPENLVRLAGRAKDAGKLSWSTRGKKSYKCKSCGEERERDRVYCRECWRKLKAESRAPGRKDNNQDEIVRALEEHGCKVIDLHKLKAGVPDLLVVTSAGEIHFMEVKREGGKLSKRQQDWHNTWHGNAYVVYGIMDALKAIGAVGN